MKPENEKITIDSSSRKNRWVAIFLAVIIPGAGDLYYGFVSRALLWVTLDVVCLGLIFVSGLGLFLLPAVWVGGILSTIISEKAYFRLIEHRYRT
jgi:hypothetical protein